MQRHDKAQGVDLTVCPVCGNTFPFRSNKKTCSARCRVKKNRTTQNGTESLSKRRQLMHRNDTAKMLAEELYSLPPCERLGYIQGLIQRAREGDTWLREVLSNHRLLKPNPIHDRHLFHRRSAEYCTISQAAQNYCKRFWKANVWEVVHNKVPEPPTGEV